MSSFRYESSLHLFNSIKKMLRNRGFYIENKDDELELLSLCEEIYNFLEDEENAITSLNLGMREPIKVLTWITNQEDFSTINQYIGRVSDVVSKFTMIYEKEKFIPEYKEYFVQKQSFDYRYRDDEIINGKKVKKEFISEMNKINNLAGVYFLYNSSKRLIYIGKSKGLGGRIPASVKERKATYFNYALTKTYSDAGIYEMYYIGLLKPKLNVDGNFPDEPTVKLPELKKTKITSIFNRRKGGKK